MTLPNNWFLWGLGWLLMPRMTIGIAITLFTGYDALGITLAIIGGILDVS